MPDLRPNGVAAVFCSDIHIQPNRPRARAGDWWDAQQHAIFQVRAVCDHYGAPLFVAGDIFDRWCCSAETINFALDTLPHCYAIPGQHDLPNHDYGARKRSAYGTLARAGKVEDMVPWLPVTLDGPGGARINVLGHPWGHPVLPTPAIQDTHQVAMAHAYIYPKGGGHVAANPLDQVNKKKASYKGWSAVVYGDNHTPWDQHLGRTQVWNCGALMRRTVADVSNQPRVALLTWDGKLQPVDLCTAQDEWADVTKYDDTVQQVDLTAVVDGLRLHGGHCWANWPEAVEAYLRDNPTDDATKTMVRQWVENAVAATEGK